MSASTQLPSDAIATEQSTSTVAATPDPMAEIKLLLRTGPWEILKIQTKFDYPIRKKVMECNAYGDESFLQRSYLSILRSCVISEFCDYKKNLEAHPIFAAFAQVNALLKAKGISGVNHTQYLHAIKTDDPSLSNQSFVDNMEQALDLMAGYITETGEIADQLRDLLDECDCTAKVEAVH